jgi:hypothetical protein
MPLNNIMKQLPVTIEINTPITEFGTKVSQFLMVNEKQQKAEALTSKKYTSIFTGISFGLAI